MAYRLVHRRCGRVAGYVDSIAVALEDGRARFRWSDGRPRDVDHPTCEGCKRRLEADDVQPVRALPGEAPGGGAP